MRPVPRRREGIGRGGAREYRDIAMSRPSNQARAGVGGHRHDQIDIAADLVERLGIGGHLRRRRGDRNKTSVGHADRGGISRRGNRLQRIESRRNIGRAVGYGYRGGYSAGPPGGKRGSDRAVEGPGYFEQGPRALSSSIDRSIEVAVRSDHQAGGDRAVTAREAMQRREGAGISPAAGGEFPDASATGRAVERRHPEQV